MLKNCAVIFPCSLAISTVRKRKVSNIAKNTVKIALIFNNIQPEAKRPGKMNRQSQFIVVARNLAPNFTNLLAITPVVVALGGWLTLAVNAAEVQKCRGEFDIRLTTYIAEALPPPPDISDSYKKERSSSSSFTPREFEFQAPPTQPVPQTTPATNLPNRQAESYLVYVNATNLMGLRQVQQVEPTAFLRQYRGRSAIQAGIFSQISNAQNLANQLEARGIDTRIANLTTKEDVDFVSNHQFYFVVIPAKRNKLDAIANQVKQLRMDLPINVSQQELPRTQVRVGPFLEKKQAENWKRYLKASGLRKVRVHYGRF